MLQATLNMAQLSANQIQELKDLEENFLSNSDLTTKDVCLVAVKNN